MTARLLALGLLACVPAAFATSVAVSARAYGCDHPGTSSASCVGPDGSSSSASAGFFPFGIHAILDAQGPSSINGLSEGSASALAFLDLLSVLGGRTGTAWVFPSVQRSVDSFTTSNTGLAAFLAYLATPGPIQVALDVPFTVTLAVDARVSADTGVHSHVDGTASIDKLIVYLQPPGTPGLQKLNGTGGLTVNLDPMVLEVYDTLAADVATPEPAAFFLLAPALIGLLLYRSR